MTFKVVINSSYGGFSLSDKAFKRWAELEGVPVYEDRGYLYAETKDGSTISSREIPRDNPNLITVVKEMGKDANGFCAHLKVVRLPDDVKDNYFIDEYDGAETIRENHRTWG